MLWKYIKCLAVLLESCPQTPLGELIAVSILCSVLMFLVCHFISCQKTLLYQ